MERFVNSNIEKQSIYDIFRACRLCGAGGGYKMPIIQNVIDLGISDIELKQKIKECVQIEVHQDDKMPPLICELCVDKVNDFYEFLEMCRQTNKHTRERLGLPSQSQRTDMDDCILGVTEPIYENNSDAPASKKTKKDKTEKKKKPPEVKVKVENTVTNERTSRSKNVSPIIPTRSTRIKVEKEKESSNEKRQRKEENIPLIRFGRNRDEKSKVWDNGSLKNVQVQVTKMQKNFSHKSILKKKTDDSLLIVRLKRLKEKEKEKELEEKFSVPDKPKISCDKCFRVFKSQSLLKDHTCTQELKSREKCKHCHKMFSQKDTLTKHEAKCPSKKKEFVIDKKLLRMLKPVQIRVTKCDSLLTNVKRKRYDVSSVSHDYGLDENCHYPYKPMPKIKKKPYRKNQMVHITQEVQDEFYDEEDYVHWDSDMSDDSDDMTYEGRRVESLVALTLKTIFTKRFLGRVPRKRRKLKTERFTFDSLFNTDFDMSKDIDSIIDNLGDDKVDSAGDDKVDSAGDIKVDSASDVKCDSGIVNQVDEEQVSGDNDVSGNVDNDVSHNDVTDSHNDVSMNGVDKINGDDDDDKRLMEEINAQLGESDDKIDRNDDKFDKKSDVITKDADDLEL